MAQIQHVRRFNGTSDWIKFVATDFVSAYGPMTMAAIIKNSINDAVGYSDILTLQGGSGGQWGFLLHDHGAQNPGVATYFDSPGAGIEEQNYAEPTLGWVLIGVTTPSAAGNSRVHQYNYGTATWTHNDHGGGATLTGPAPSGSPSLRVGTWNESIEFLDADVAVVGCWKSTSLSDGNFETLEADIASWEALTPTGLWLFNQTTTSDPVLDRVGNGDQTAINGTSVVAESTLAFDVGAGATPPTLYPLVTASPMRW